MFRQKSIAILALLISACSSSDLTSTSPGSPKSGTDNGPLGITAARETDDQRSSAIWDPSTPGILRATLSNFTNLNASVEASLRLLTETGIREVKGVAGSSLGASSRGEVLTIRFDDIRQRGGVSAEELERSVVSLDVRANFEDGAFQRIDVPRLVIRSDIAAAAQPDDYPVALVGPEALTHDKVVIPPTVIPPRALPSGRRS